MSTKRNKKPFSAPKSNRKQKNTVQRIPLGHLYLTDFHTLTKTKKDSVREKFVRDNINKKNLCIFCWDERKGKRFITTDEDGQPFHLWNDLMRVSNRLKWEYERKGEPSYMAMFATDDDCFNGINADEVFAYHITNISEDRKDYYDQSSMYDDIAEIANLAMAMLRARASDRLHEAVGRCCKIKKGLANCIVSKFLCDRQIQKIKKLRSRLPKDGFISQQLEADIRECCDYVFGGEFDDFIRFNNEQYAAGRIEVVFVA